MRTYVRVITGLAQSSGTATLDGVSVRRKTSTIEERGALGE
jgi:hypothetical protein